MSTIAYIVVKNFIKSLSLRRLDISSTYSAFQPLKFWDCKDTNKSVNTKYFLLLHLKIVLPDPVLKEGIFKDGVIGGVQHYHFFLHKGLFHALYIGR